MAKFEQVMKLIDAGYTKAEIEALMQPAQEPETPAEPVPVSEPVPAETVPVSEPVPEQQDTQAAILAAINKLSNAMITNNINTQMQPGATERSVQQALAEIIAPPPAEKRKI